MELQTGNYPPPKGGSHMKQKIFRSPFAARLLLLTAVLLLSCCVLASCQVEPAEQTDDPVIENAPSGEGLESNATAPWTGHPFSSEDFFASYVTDFPEYTYTGAHSATVLGRTIELEDTPENFAEEMVWNNCWLPFVGNFEPYIALMGSNHMRISAENEGEQYAENGGIFSSVTVHNLSVLTQQDYQPGSFYFSEQATAERFMTDVWHEVWTYGLTEYTVAYVDLSWEWTPEQLALGPQLGNGRYERLCLLGKTAADPDWKMYNIYWGEYDLDRFPEESDPTSGSLRLPDEHFVLLPIGEPVSVDLNGDGTPETLLVDLIQGGDSPSYALSVNGSDYYTTLTQLGIHVDCPQEQFAITDLDAGDVCLEIALADEGPSNDPHTIFLRWDGTDLISLGEVYGMVSDGDLTFLGDGVVDSYFRLSVLQTWCAPVLWRFNPTGEFGIVHQDLYYPLPYSETQIITVQKDLAAYADRNSESERTILPAGTKFTLTATDNARWVQCADESGKQFWLQLDETSGHKVELSDGSYSWGALDGLNLAD